MAHPLIEGLEVKIRTLKATKPRSERAAKEINRRIALAENELKAIGGNIADVVVEKKETVVETLKASLEDKETVAECGNGCDCAPGECKENDAQEVVEEIEEVVEEPVAEEDPGSDSTDWSSLTRDELKAALTERDIEFANNAKTTKLVALLEESEQ